MELEQDWMTLPFRIGHNFRCYSSLCSPTMLATTARKITKASACEIKTVLETLTPSMVPAYLRDSEFGASLNYDDDEEFSVPIGVTKQSLEVDSLKDLSHLLATCRFWGLHSIPATVMRIAFTKDRAKVLPILSKFSAELKQMAIVAKALKAAAVARMNVAMSSGYLDLVKYLHSKGHNISDDSIRRAVENGHSDCLQYALQQNWWMVRTACTTAVVCRSLACIQVILKQFEDFPHKDPASRGCGGDHPAYNVSDAAASIGDVEYLERALQRGWTFTGHTLTVAGCHGQLQCLKYLHEIGCSWDYDTMKEIVCHKQFNCAEYVLQHGGFTGYDYTFKVIDGLAAAGELRCLSLLSDATLIMGMRRVRPCLLAAQHGHLDCLKFLREQRYPWDKTVTTAAAQAGHYECLWYAVQHGCPVDAQVCSILAAKGGEQLLMQFAQLNVPYCTVDIATCAAANGYMECLTYAVEHGCLRVAPICTAAAANGKLQCLQYLRAEGFPWDKSTTAQAALKRATIAA